MLAISPILKILLTILKIILKYRNYPSVLTLSVGRNDIKVFFSLLSKVCKEQILKDILNLSCSIYSETEEKVLFIYLFAYLSIYLFIKKWKVFVSFNRESFLKK